MELFVWFGVAIVLFVLGLGVMDLIGVFSWCRHPQDKR